MACNVPTNFPSECVSDILGAIKGGGLKSGAVLAKALYVGSYFAGLLPDSFDATDDGVLTMTAPMSDENAVNFLEAQLANHDQGVVQALDLGKIMQIIQYLRQIYELYRGLKG